MAKHVIEAPMPGTFYRRPDPDTPVFTEDGVAVSAGDAIGLIEVMKMFNEVSCDVDGTSITFVAEDGEPIMAGDPIAEVEL